jgi:hypothetical protein
MLSLSFIEWYGSSDNEMVWNDDNGDTKDKRRQDVTRETQATDDMNGQAQSR